MFGCARSLLLHRLFSSWGAGLLFTACTSFSLWGFSCGDRALGRSSRGSCSTWAQEWQFPGFGVVHGLTCSTAPGIFPAQGSNLCLLNWQVNSLPLSHKGSPKQNYDVTWCVVFITFLLSFLDLWVYSFHEEHFGSYFLKRTLLSPLFFRSPSLTGIRLFEVVSQHWFSVVFVLVFLSFGLFLLLCLQVYLLFLQCTFWFRYFTFHFQKFDMDITFHVSLWHAVFSSTWANEV